MNISIPGRVPFILCATVAMLTGCDGSQSQLPTTGVDTTNARTSAAKIILVGTGWVAPLGVAVDDKGDVFVADYQLDEVREVSPPFNGRTHGKIRVLAKALDSPISVALDGKGNVYIAGGGILQITPTGVRNTVTTQIYGGIAADANEDVYVASNNSLYFIQHKAGGGWKNPAQIPPTNINNAVAVALDGRNNLYAVVTPNGKSPTALKIEPGGKTTLIGSAWQGPEGIAVPMGCKTSCPVYVSDGNNVKKVVPPFTGPHHGKTTIIGYGFSGPIGVAAKGTNVYVSDTGNAQVKEVLP
jgi:hypothetical protein